MIGFGVAGNFTGHLEQAGKAASFSQGSEQKMPFNQKRFSLFMYQK